MTDAPAAAPEGKAPQTPAAAPAKEAPAGPRSRAAMTFLDADADGNTFRAYTSEGGEDAAKKPERPAPKGKEAAGGAKGGADSGVAGKAPEGKEAARGNDQAAPADEGAADAAEDGDEGQLPAGLKHRLARAKAREQAALAEAAELRKRIEALERGERAEAEAEPDQNDFETFAAYEAALAAHNAKKAEAQAAAEKEAKPDNTRRDPAPAEAAQAAKFLQDYLGEVDVDLWLQMIDLKDWQIRTEALVGITRLDRPELVLRHLVDHKSVLDRMNTYGSERLLIELGRLEQRLLDAEKLTAERKTSRAPAPLPVGGSRSAAGSPSMAEKSASRVAAESGDFAAFERARDQEDQRGRGWK